MTLSIPPGAIEIHYELFQNHLITPVGADYKHEQKKVPHGPAFPKSSEQIVSKMLTIFLEMPVACNPFCSHGSDSEQNAHYFFCLDAGCLLASYMCIEEEGVHGKYSFDGVSAGVLASGGD